MKMKFFAAAAIYAAVVAASPTPVDENAAPSLHIQSWLTAHSYYFKIVQYEPTLPLSPSRHIHIP